MIELKNIHLLVGSGNDQQRSILNGLNLRINQGDFITIVGTNGAGKSTLLDVIAGEKQPAIGSISINEVDITNLPAFARSHLVARVSQDSLLGCCGELTVLENALLAKLRGQQRTLKHAETIVQRQKLTELIATLNLGLEHKLDVPMKQLSGGQRQALCLLLTTLSPMQVLLLDEHISALDPRTGKQIMDLTAQIIQEQNLTALMITHNLTSALRYGNRTLVLRDGIITHDLSDSHRANLVVNDLMELLEFTV